MPRGHSIALSPIHGHSLSSAWLSPRCPSNPAGPGRNRAHGHHVSSVSFVASVGCLIECPSVGDTSCFPPIEGRASPLGAGPCSSPAGACAVLLCDSWVPVIPEQVPSAGLLSAVCHLRRSMLKRCRYFCSFDLLFPGVDSFLNFIPWAVPVLSLMSSESHSSWLLAQGGSRLTLRSAALCRSG